MEIKNKIAKNIPFTQEIVLKNCLGHEVAANMGRWQQGRERPRGHEWTSPLRRWHLPCSQQARLERRMRGGRATAASPLSRWDRAAVGPEPSRGRSQLASSHRVQCSVQVSQS